MTTALPLFAQAILAAMLTHAPVSKPSPYSFEPAPGCGVNPAAPTCRVEPLCASQGLLCAAPRYSRARGAWVRVERPSARIARYGAIARALARAAMMQSRCKDQHGAVTEDCEPPGWPGGPMTLAFSALSAATWESGFREDIQFGHAPLGRGPGGEVCLMQMMPDQVINVATWVPKAEREKLKAQMTWKENKEWGVKQLLGGPNHEEQLYRCFVAGMNHLTRARKACSRRAPNWVHGMYSMYGTGQQCVTHGLKNDFAEKRVATFWKMRRAYTGKPPKLPDDVVRILGLAPHNGADAPS